MLRRFLHTFAYLLLLVMPLQGIAAANMLVCNSLMQSNYNLSLQSADTVTNTMPCHEAMANVAEHQQTSSTASEKEHCGALCSSLCTVAALPHLFNLCLNTSASTGVIASDQTYASITLPTFQRPPIFLS